MSKPVALSVFSGAGGMDLGLESAGWSICAQIEMDHDCADTLRGRVEAAHLDTRVIEQRIEDVDPTDLRRELELRRGQLELLAGGPPCQPFTTTGLRQGINDRRASSAFPTYLKYVSVFEPQMLWMENVDGLLSAALKHRPLNERGKNSPALGWEERKGSFLFWLLGELSQLGYSVSWGVLEAADYGVAQFRQRAFLIGVREDIGCFPPGAMFGQQRMPPYRNLHDALARVKVLGAVQPLSERKRSVFRLIPPGGNWRDLPESTRRATMGAAFHATGGKSGWWRRLAWDEPAPTILGMPDHSSTALIHPDEVRCLSVNECAAVQSFPTKMSFCGRPRSQYQQIGNAVPPLLAEAVGKKLIRFLEGERQEPPPPPPWRKLSANRRIGTHGWCKREHGELRCHLISRVREDHVWASSAQLQLQC